MGISEKREREKEEGKDLDGLDFFVLRAEIG